MNGRLYEALWLTQELPDILNLNYYVSGSGYLVATVATTATVPHRLADVDHQEDHLEDDTIIILETQDNNRTMVSNSKRKSKYQKYLSGMATLTKFLSG